jgi:CRP-like cAMP-binding protein
MNYPSSGDLEEADVNTIVDAKEEESHSPLNVKALRAFSENDEFFEIKGYKFKASLLQYFQSMRHLGGLTDASFKEFSRRMVCVSLQRNQILFNKGDTSTDGVYIVLKGKVASLTEPESVNYSSEIESDQEELDSQAPSLDRAHIPINYKKPYCDPVTKHEINNIHTGSSFGIHYDRTKRNVLATYTPGMSIGEEALLDSKSTRCVSTVAVTDTVLLRVDITAFEWLMDKHPPVVAAFLLSTVTRHWRVSYFALVDLLSPEAVWKLVSDSNMPAFQTGAPAFDSIPSLSKVIVNLSPKEKLYGEGDIAHSLYIVMKGEIRTTLGIKKSGKDNSYTSLVSLGASPANDIKNFHRSFGAGC